MKQDKQISIYVISQGLFCVLVHVKSLKTKNDDVKNMSRHIFWLYFIFVIWFFTVLLTIIVYNLPALS